jgi:hypothetical protein
MVQTLYHADVADINGTGWECFCFHGCDGTNEGFVEEGISLYLVE